MMTVPLRPPSLTLLDKYRGKDGQTLYSTTVTVTGGESGHGRASGIARSDEERFTPYTKMARQGIENVVALAPPEDAD
jgi:lipoyl-dependent peroxiredoxin